MELLLAHMDETEEQKNAGAGKLHARTITPLY